MNERATSANGNRDGAGLDVSAGLYIHGTWGLIPCGHQLRNTNTIGRDVHQGFSRPVGLCQLGTGHSERLQMVISQLHGSASTHQASVPVTELFQGRTVWQGAVEVFTLANHPKAKRCYAWSHDSDTGERFVAVLEIPPVTDPVTAVRASIVADSKKL